MPDRYLTTVDNPYHPVDQFKEWYQYDTSHGYFTVELLGRVMVDAPTLSPADQDEAREIAIDAIINENLSGVHRVVYANGKPKTTVNQGV